MGHFFLSKESDYRTIALEPLRLDIDPVLLERLLSDISELATLIRTRRTFADMVLRSNSRGVVPEQELVETVVWVAARDGFESPFQVGERFDAVDLRCLDQRGNTAPGLGALIVAGEERILSVDGNRAYEVLDGIGVDLDPAVGQEGQ